MECRCSRVSVRRASTALTISLQPCTSHSEAATGAMDEAWCRPTHVVLAWLEFLVVVSP